MEVNFRKSNPSHIFTSSAVPAVAFRLNPGCARSEWPAAERRCGAGVRLDGGRHEASHLHSIREWCHKGTPPPNELFKLHQRLCELDYAGSEAWVPKDVEVMLWDYSYAPEASIQWPKEWPTLHSDRALKREGSYSIFLDGALLPKLRKFLATRREKGASKSREKVACNYAAFTMHG